MKKLNDNGRMICQMAATIASGLMANPAYNNQPIQADDMMQLAADMCRCALSHPELCQEDALQT